jgi:hypothetical protein
MYSVENETRNNRAVGFAVSLWIRILDVLCSSLGWNTSNFFGFLYSTFPNATPNFLGDAVA